ncbi:MAG: flavin reductase family protein [Chloroflexota bacterium]
MTATADQSSFRNAMARFASGVTVCTTRNSDGVFVGFTASAFSSLSLNPPMLLVCLQKDAECYTAFMDNDAFAVSILAHGQSDIARRFATKNIDKWHGTPVTDGEISGLPLITGASAHCECWVTERVDGGDHTILVGLVERAEVSEHEPMVHYNRRFGYFVEEEVSPD